MTVRILRGDCLDILKTLPDESVHCCVTSPPYYGLRDYGVAGQLGLESTLAEYVANMVAVFREVRRVLRGDGTLWLNIGDSYAANRGYQVPQLLRGGQAAADAGSAGGRGMKASDYGLKVKDLMGVPWRLAFALQDDGWYLRQDIIWNKPNPMPESVRDRCTKAHEYIFLMAKSERYYYDQEAVAEKSVGRELFGNSRSKGNCEQRQDNDRQDMTPTETRNRRSVWTVATQPFNEAHFATFPPDLIEPCILAGLPVGGTVLDPFGGAGTTGLVADRLQRDAILIELNPAYADMAERRIRSDSPLFADVA